MLVFFSAVYGDDSLGFHENIDKHRLFDKKNTKIR